MQKQGKADISGTEASSIPCNKGRLLIADDEKGIRSIFQQVVSYGMPNCRVDLAVNGLEAVESFRTNHQDVLLMDCCMPEMDGWTAFCKIQEICDKCQWEMPSVIFCTGYNPPSQLAQYLKDNSRHCLLLKPVRNEVLLKALSSRMKPDKSTTCIPDGERQPA